MARDIKLALCGEELVRIRQQTADPYDDDDWDQIDEPPKDSSSGPLALPEKCEVSATKLSSLFPNMDWTGMGVSIGLRTVYVYDEFEDLIEQSPARSPGDKLYKYTYDEPARSGEPDAPEHRRHDPEGNGEAL
jgi:hypothetical protein